MRAAFIDAGLAGAILENDILPELRRFDRFGAIDQDVEVLIGDLAAIGVDERLQVPVSRRPGHRERHALLHRDAIIAKDSQRVAEFLELIPGLRRAVRQAGLGKHVGIVVEQRRAAHHRQRVERAIVVAVHDQPLEEAAHVQALFGVGSEVIQRDQHAVLGKQGHERRVQQHQVRHFAGDQRRLQLLQDFGVLALELHLDLDLVLRLVEQLRQLVLNVAGDAGQSAPVHNLDRLLPAGDVDAWHQQSEHQQDDEHARLHSTPPLGWVCTLTTNDD